MNIIDVIKILSIFVVLFPLVMAIVWSVGGLFHQLKYNEKLSEEDLELEEQKFIILVPVFNEEKEIKKHVEELLKLNYSNYELWVLDDCSNDNSYLEINKVKDSKLICHKNKKNLGKAATLNKILDKIDTEYFLVIDSDTMVDINILKKLNCEIKKDQKEDNNKYAGYTGNVTVYGEKEDRNLIIQKIEYRTFIDMIKRSQMVLFKSVMTLSGACSCYKTDVIRTIGKFNEKNATEDIEISWRLNQEGIN